MGNKIKSIREALRKKKIICIVVIAIILILAILATIIFNIKTPTLSLEGPKNKIEIGDEKEITVYAVLSTLPDNNYPAASASIKFDEKKLQFVRVDMGTMETYDNYDENVDIDNYEFKIPQWTYNVEAANREGVVNTIYLDTTAGKNSYSQQGFRKHKKDIPFKLIFKLRSSVLPGDNIELKIDNAVFATVNGEEDKTTLSTKENYSKLKVKSEYINIEKN